MNELIKITTNEDGVQCVSARELHGGLKVQQDFSDWIKKQLNNVDAVENGDYTLYWYKNDDPFKKVVKFNGNVNSMVRNGYESDYVLTADIAKEICMIVGVSPRTNAETKTLSKEFRKYFIECEKKLKSQVPQLTKKQQLQLSILNGDDLEKISSLAQYETLIIGEATKPLLDKIEEDKPKVDYYERMLITVGCRTVTDIAKDYGLNVQKLNKILHEQDVQYKSKSGQWLLYKKHDGKGYVQTSTYITKNNEAKYTTKWTAKGQKFIYDLLKELGINPNQ